MAFLALDQGTTSSRALVFGDDGALLGLAQHEFRQHFPGPGMVEHDAEEIFATTAQAMREAVAAAGAPAIAAVGITNQRETVVVFDRQTLRPLHRAIVWQDRRTRPELQAMQAAGHGPRVQALSGLPLDPYFSAAKIAWLLDRIDGGRERAARGELGAATIDAWLLCRLTEGRVFATEPGNASRTALFDIHRGQWSDELCALFRVPRACLPEVRPSAGDFGRVAATGWPIRGVLGDQQAALFGHGGFAPGSAKCTYGTGAFLLLHAGDRAPVPAHGLLATIAWRVGDRTSYALEGSVLVSGALVQWLRDGLGIVARSDQIEPLARSVEDSGGVVIVPSFQGLGTPHWDPDARGLIVGLTRATTRAHLARAALEAIALQVHDLVLAMQAALGRRFESLRVDGGGAANSLLLELQAALLEAPVIRPQQLETTALGAARIAMLGAGGMTRPEQLPPLSGAATTVPPRPLPERDRVLARWREAVQRARGWAAV